MKPSNLARRFSYKTIASIVIVILAALAIIAISRHPNPNDTEDFSDTENVNSMYLERELTTHDYDETQLSDTRTDVDAPRPEPKISIHSEGIDPAQSYSVKMKNNANYSLLADIYLVDAAGMERYYTSVSEVDIDHYHGAEYIKGTLYVTRRTGGDNGPETHPKWTDELWKYDASGNGTKLYRTPGLDFRVSPDQSMISISTNYWFILLGPDGTVIKSFGRDEISANPEETMGFNLLAWGNNAVWVEDTFGPVLVGIVKIDLPSFKLTKYDFAAAPFGEEYSFNPQRQAVAFSTHPIFFGADEYQDYLKTGESVSLKVFDINTKASQVIATSITKEFHPAWIDADTLEYDNPSGANRITRKVY